MDNTEIEKIEALIRDTKTHPRTSEELESLRVSLLGKDGVFRRLFADLRSLSADEKPQTAAKLNELKSLVEGMLASQGSLILSELNKKKLQEQRVDLTYPMLGSGIGRAHPITRVELDIAEVLTAYGFRHVEGPEAEEEYYCFDALNIPKHHPARDMQDTFYTDTQQVLRTHTSSVQTRELEKKELPVKIACRGRVYRNETIDASHSDMFHQYEVLWVEPGLKLPHLLDLLTQVLKELYGKSRKIKFVPKFYPYTEPSIGALINSLDGSGWTTVGGAGMVHRKVLQEFGYDVEKVSGLAFGLGTSRLVSERFGIPTMRDLYDNDLRILKKLV